LISISSVVRMWSKQSLPFLTMPSISSREDTGRLLFDSLGFWGQCYDFKNNLAKKWRFWLKIVKNNGFQGKLHFLAKLVKIAENSDHNIDPRIKKRICLN
jgi:hypothetical protein